MDEEMKVNGDMQEMEQEVPEPEETASEAHAEVPAAEAMKPEVSERELVAEDFITEEHEEEPEAEIVEPNAAEEAPESEKMEPETSAPENKREFSSLSAAAGKIVAAVDDADSEAASAAQEAEWSAAERAAAKEAQESAAQAAAESAASAGSDSFGYAAAETGGFSQEGPLAGAEAAAVDYSVAKGSSVDVFSTEKEEANSWAWAFDDDVSISEKEDLKEEAEDKNRISGSFSSLYSDTEGGGTFSPIPEEPVSGKKSGSNGLLKKILAGVLAVLMCFGGGYAGSVIGNKVNSVATGGTAAGGTGAVSITGDVDSLNAASVIAEKTMPSVVGISTVSQTLTETIFGLQSGESMGIGTGLIVSEDGYILTNSHVVNDGDAETITVDLYDGTEYSGTILWNDASLDLAIVKIEASGLVPAELGDSDTVSIGDYALAIGNPLGLDFERSVTSGIISGLNRSITVAASADATTGNTMDGLIQTDASINSGNSGGPLINSSGQIIGINSAKASSAEGLGFAIPINVAIPIIQQIMETGTFESAYIGINGYDLAAVSSSLNTEFNTKNGVYVNEIFSGSGAANAGIQPGDVIVAVEGHDIDGMSSLKKQLINYRPGDTIAVTVERNKEEITVDVVLGSASQMTETIPQEQNEQQDQNQNNGTDPFSEGQDENNGQMPQQPEDGSNGFEYGPGGLGDLFNNFFGN